MFVNIETIWVLRENMLTRMAGLLSDPTLYINMALGQGNQGALMWSLCPAVSGRPMQSPIQEPIRANPIWFPSSENILLVIYFLQPDLAISFLAGINLF